MKYQFIEDAKKAFPITLMCKVLHAPRSGFYAWKKNKGKSHTEAENENLVPLVKEIHRKKDATYGTPEGLQMSQEIEVSHVVVIKHEHS